MSARQRPCSENIACATRLSRSCSSRSPLDRSESSPFYPSHLSSFFVSVQPLSTPALATLQHFCYRPAIIDHTVRATFSTPHASRATEFATQDHARARNSNAAQGNTKDTEATSANLLRKKCQGCSEARRPSCPASRIQSSGAIVTSQPWIQLTGGYARCAPF